MEKTDLKKQFKSLYLPKSKEFSVVEVPALQFVSIQGQGAPEGEAYAQAVQWLYATLYPMKFIAKKKLGKDFVVPPLEGLWWADDMDDYISGNRAGWKWQMMIATPDWVDEALFEEGLAKACTKLGTRPESLQFGTYHEGKAVQILHIGPYSEEAPTIAKMHEDLQYDYGLELERLL